MANEEQYEEIEKIREEFLNITDSIKLREDISSLYCKQKYSDVTLILDGQKIHAHKAILAARSEYFDSLFCRNLEQREITLTDIPSRAFGKVLKYIYTGSINITETDVESILDVLQLASTYFLKNLESTLANKLIPFINMKNACSFLNQANSNDISEMRDACLALMDKNVSEILASDSLNNLTQKSMIKLLERDTFAAPEIDIFKSVAKWCKINDDVDKLVLKCVRFSLLSEEEILLIVRPSKLVEDTTLLNIRTEIVERKPRSSNRRLILKDQNIATLKHKAQVIINTDFLLINGVDDNDKDEDEDEGKDEDGDEDEDEDKDVENKPKCASHSFGDKNGITVRLGVLSCINRIYMKLWEGKERRYEYSYYIEVSVDGIKWQKVIDYSLYRCRSYQNLYLEQEIIAQYIRVVGTHSTKNEVFDLVFFKAYFKSTFPRVINGIVCPTNNVATTGKGAVLVEGAYGYGSKHLSDVIYHSIDAENIIVQLAQPYLISYIKLKLVDPEDTYRYFIETSINKSDWEIAVDRRHNDCQGEQILHFSARPTVYIKITGTYTSDVRVKSLYCQALECYYSDCT